MIVNVGLIGPRSRPGGYGIGKYIAREVLNYPLSDLVAIMGTSIQTVEQSVIDINSRKDILKKFKGRTYTTNYKNDFLNNQEINLIIICSPAETHEEYIRQALVYNKHILVEKPLLQNFNVPLEQRLLRAYDLVNLANSKNLILSTNCQRAAIVPILSEEFGYSTQPTSLDIVFFIQPNSSVIENHSKLFDLLIAHPLSILVKYGVNNRNFLKVNNFRLGGNSESTILHIEGIYDYAGRFLSFSINLNQSIKNDFTSMKINVDKNGFVEITSETSPSGQIVTKYKKIDDTITIIKYSEDLLKISIGQIIDAVYYRYKTKNPLINNYETYLIYTLQEELRKKISSKHFI